jgi:hypothetical protein
VRSFEREVEEKERWRLEKLFQWSGLASILAQKVIRVLIRRRELKLKTVTSDFIVCLDDTL